MTPHWTAAKDYFEIAEMPFYWRLKTAPASPSIIGPRMPIRLRVNEKFDYLTYEPTANEWSMLSNAYKQNENIGFINPESGQLHTYGSSVNRFFLETIQKYSPRSIFEIGCGAGYTIQFLKENGWRVTGVDPSEYSKLWSQKLDFALINEFFTAGVLGGAADFIYCNDVFEHIREVEDFSRNVFHSLADGGVFCIATTNSTRSIEVGDISMLEHQHVNMFTDRSIELILRAAGFAYVEIKPGSYGNTFHIIARKVAIPFDGEQFGASARCKGFFERAVKKVEYFKQIYERSHDLHCYVPLRCLPYLATVGDFGRCPIYDSNIAWRGKYIDGYDQPIRAVQDIEYRPGVEFFIGSATFFHEIKKTLVERGVPAKSIYGVI